MDAAKTMGDRYREARLRAVGYNPRLATIEGAAEVLDVSPDTVGRWEREDTIPSNQNVKRMAVEYHAPDLMMNYCAYQCIIGKGLHEPVESKPIEQSAIRLRNQSSIVYEAVEKLLYIAEDGIIDDYERKVYGEVIADLRSVRRTIDEFIVHHEKHQMEGGQPRCQPLSPIVMRRTS